MDYFNKFNNSNFKNNNNKDYSLKPKLVQNHTKDFIKSVLIKSNKYKLKYYSYYYNIILFTTFISILSFTLYYRYTYVKKQKINNNYKNNYYIMNKLINYNKIAAANTNINNYNFSDKNFNNNIEVDSNKNINNNIKNIINNNINNNNNNINNINNINSINH